MTALRNNHRQCTTIGFQSFDVIIKDMLKHIFIEASYEARNVIRRKAVHGNDFGLLISLVKRISWDLAGISHERLERGLGLLRSCMKIASPHFMGRRHAPRPPNHHHPCHLYFAFKFLCMGPCQPEDTVELSNQIVAGRQFLVEGAHVLGK